MKKIIQSVINSDKISKNIIFVAIFALIGVSLLLFSIAATPFASLEPEAGTKTAAISTFADTTASGGSAVKFGTGSVAPPPTGGCPPYPAMPDANCTGWRHTGVTLTPQGKSAGDNYFRVDTPGAVVDSKDINASVCIAASNVIIKRSRVVGGIAISNGVSGGCWGPAVTGILIEDVEIDGQGYDGVAVDSNVNYTARRVHVHGSANGFRLASNVTIEDSYVVATVGGPGSHRTAIGANSGLNLIIRHNNLDCSVGEGCSAALSLYTQPSQDNVLVENNLFNTQTGVYCLYAPNTSATNVRIINNRFGRKYHPGCGSGGPIGSSLQSGNGNVWSGNVWDDTGQPL